MFDIREKKEEFSRVLFKTIDILRWICGISIHTNNSPIIDQLLKVCPSERFILHMMIEHQPLRKFGFVEMIFLMGI